MARKNSALYCFPHFVNFTCLLNVPLFGKCDDNAKMRHALNDGRSREP